MLDPAADRLDRGRNDIASVSDGGGTEHNDELGTGAKQFVDRCGKSVLLVGNAALPDNVRTRRRQALLRHFECLLNDLGGKAGQQGRDHTNLSDAVRRNAQERRALARDDERRIALWAGHGEWNDLDGRDHLAGYHRLVGRQRRECD